MHTRQAYYRSLPWLIAHYKQNNDIKYLTLWILKANVIQIWDAVSVIFFCKEGYSYLSERIIWVDMALSQTSA